MRCEYEGGRLPHPAPSEPGRVGVLLGLRLRLTSGALVAVDSPAALAARGEPAARRPLVQALAVLRHGHPGTDLFEQSCYR